MARKSAFFALLIVSAAAGVVSGANDAWREHPQGNPQLLKARPAPFPPFG